MASRFSPGEIRAIIIAWIALSVGITFNYLLDLLAGIPGSLEAIASGFIAAATGFIFHEMGHKYVAERRGYVAHFRLWRWGIAMTLATAIFSRGGFLFGAPGAVYITPAAIQYYRNGYYSSTSKIVDRDQENMIISAAGPVLNLAFALFFFVLFNSAPLNSFAEIVGFFGFSLNVGLGSFNMIPFPQLDGFKIFKKNFIVGLTIALPLWAMFAYILFL